MSRRREPNRWGCKPSEDVCLEHCMPLVCRHGCEEVKEHQCMERQMMEREASKKENVR